MDRIAISAFALSGMFVAATASAAPFVDTFDSIDPAWVVDRYAPAQFASVGGKLEIGIDNAPRPGSFSGTFYNTHGKKRAIADVDQPWSVSATLTITEDMLETTGNTLKRTDIWTYNGLAFPILGFANNDPSQTDPASTPGAAGRLARFRAYNTDTGAWTTISSVTPQVGDYVLTIKDTGSAFEYYIDNALVHTSTGYSSGEVGEVFLQAYAFGGANENYSVSWDNLNVVPEPGTLSLLAIGAAAMLRRRRA